MRMMRYSSALVVFVFFLVGLTFAQARVRVSEIGTCPVDSLADAILGFRDSVSDLHHGGESNDVAVIEGDEVSLQKALDLVYSNRQDYVAVLFYASWCPFSRNFKRIFSVLSSLYPSIPHLAIEESAIMPRVLSIYGVHGFPALFLLNSTMRVRYRGTRNLGAPIAFYRDVTGIKSDSRDQLPDIVARTLNHDQLLDIARTLNHESNNRTENSPENLFKQEPYLVLAIIFVLLRLLYFFYPYLFGFARQTWRRYMLHVRIRTLWEHPLRYLNRAKLLFHSMKDLCKGTNFQGGAINARAWASKSLASAVAIGDASTSRGITVGANH